MRKVFVIILLGLLLSPNVMADPKLRCDQAVVDLSNSCSASENMALFQAIFQNNKINNSPTKELVAAMAPCTADFLRCAKACGQSRGLEDSSPEAILRKLKTDNSFASRCRNLFINELEQFASKCPDNNSQLLGAGRGKVSDSNLTVIRHICNPPDEASAVAAAGASSSGPATSDASKTSGRRSAESGATTCRIEDDVTCPTGGTTTGGRWRLDPKKLRAYSPETTSPSPSATQPSQSAGGGIDETLLDGGAATTPGTTATNTENDASVDGLEDDPDEETVNPFAGGGGGDSSVNPFGEDDANSLMDLANNIGAGSIPDVRNASVQNNTQLGNYRVQPIDSPDIQAGRLTPDSRLRLRRQKPQFRGFSDEKKQAIQQANQGQGAGAGGPPGGGGGSPGFGGSNGAASAAGGRPNPGRRRGRSALRPLADQVGANSFYGGSNAAAGSGAAKKKDKDKKGQVGPATATTVAAAIPQAYDPNVGLRMINSQFKKGLKNYLIKVGDTNQTPAIFKEINYNYTVGGDRLPRRFLNSKGRNK